MTLNLDDVEYGPINNMREQIKFKEFKFQALKMQRTKVRATVNISKLKKQFGKRSRIKFKQLKKK